MSIDRGVAVLRQPVGIFEHVLFASEGAEEPSSARVFPWVVLTHVIYSAEHLHLQMNLDNRNELHCKKVVPIIETFRLQSAFKMVRDISR